MALDFNGNNQSVNCGHDDSLNITTSFSISVWVIPRDTEDEKGYVICSREEASDDRAFYTRLWDGSDISRWLIDIILSEDGTAFVHYRVTLTESWNDVLMHLVFVYTSGGSPNVKIYLDGTEKSGSWEVGSAPASIVSAPDNDFTIGVRRGNVDYFSGKIYDLRYYSRALSDAEIATIYHAQGADNIINGLVGRWLMNEKADGSATTGYGNGYLYLEGDVRGSSLRNVWKPQAWYFSGTYNRTYWTWIDRVGDIKIAYYDHDTTETSQVYDVAPATDYSIDQPHANPTIAIDNDGYIHIFYGCHNSPMKYRKSTNPEDLTSFSGAADVVSNATYPNTAVSNDNVIFVLYRGLGKDLYLIESADGGVNWVNNTELFDYPTGDFNGVYPLGIVLGNETPTQSIHILASTRPSAFDKLYYMKSLDGGTTWRKADGTEITLPATTETADCVESTAEAHPGDIKLNSSNEPYVLYSLNETFKFARWSGSEWVKSTIATIALRTYEHSELIVVSDDVIDAYLVEGTKEGFRGGNIQRWRSIDRGSTWSKAEDITTDATVERRHFYPKVVHNNVNDLKLIWMYGEPTSGGGENVIFWSYPINIFPHIGDNIVIDISGNGNHGTPQNSPIYRAAPVRLVKLPIIIGG